MGWGALVCLSLLAALSVRVDTTTESILHRHAPEWAFYQSSLEGFGNDEVVVLAFHSTTPFNPKTLADVALVSRRLEELRGVRRVDSITTLPIIWPGKEGGVSLKPAADPSTGALRKGGRERLLGDAVAPRTVVSEDGRVLAVNVFPDDTVSGNYESFVQAILDTSGARHSWVSGVPIFRTESNSRTRTETLTFVPLTVVAIALLLLVVFRSWRAPVLGVLVSGAGCVGMVGSMGLLGEPLTFSTMILPSIVLALGCAYVMHVLTATQGVVSRVELQRRVEHVAGPIAVSGLTTAIGLLSAMLIDIEAIQAIGLFGSIGVMLVLAASLSLAPAVLALLPLRTPESRLTSWLRTEMAPRLVLLASRRRWVLLGGWCSLLIVSVFGLLDARIETDATRWFPRGSPVRDSYEAIRARLSGISPMNVIVKAGDGESVVASEYLVAIQGLDSFVSSLPDVGKVVSISDVLGQTHWAFSGEVALPGTAGLAEQYLLFLETVDQLDDLVSADRRSANILIRANNNGSARLREIASAAELWWRSNGPVGSDVQATGIMFEFARAEDQIAIGQLRSLAFAFGVISLTLFWVLRTPAIALASLVPNALPLTMAFGGMGYFGIPLDASTVILGSLALGVAVDDTVHLASGFQRGRRRGQSPDEALYNTLSEVLPALVYTTVIVASGFAVLGLSGFTLTRNLGLLTSCLVLLCLLADLTLLPALLSLRPPWKQARSTACDPR